jgi:hypothetical protein
LVADNQDVMSRRHSTLDGLIGLAGLALLLAGAVSAVFGPVGMRRKLWALLASTGDGAGRVPRLPTDGLPRLARAIVGNTRGAVASVLGPPRIATFVGRGLERPATDYRDAEVWYYPLPEHAGRMGMAIRFEEQRAASVEFFGARGVAGPMIAGDTDVR